MIHVRRAWDGKEGEIEPKSEAGTRRVPIAAVLRRILVEHKLRQAGERCDADRHRLRRRGEALNDADRASPQDAGRRRDSSRSAFTSAATPSPH